MIESYQQLCGLCKHGAFKMKGVLDRQGSHNVSVEKSLGRFAFLFLVAERLENKSTAIAR